jgi:hypothetical protein
MRKKISRYVILKICRNLEIHVDNDGPKGQDAPQAAMGLYLCSRPACAALAEISSGYPLWYHTRGSHGTTYGTNSYW